jgi:23S rRNA pseudouridine2605 synthase
MPDGERLQKIIANAGIASRRKAEAMILEGRVTVNGRVVTELGTRADAATDHIKVDGKLIRQARKKVYFLLNKPRQVMSTVSDPAGRVKVIDLINTREKVYPVGRLDYDTEGLILLTNDGEFARIMSSAGDFFPKAYHVKVRSTPDESTLRRLRSGIRLKDGAQLAPCRIVPLRGGNNSWYEVTLIQGKNRQIRDMFESVGHPVLKLRRTRIGFLTADSLAVGGYRPLHDHEVARIMRLGARHEGSRTRSRV